MHAEGEPGSRSYFEDLLRARFEYGPWMPASLGYDETDGLRVLDVGCGQGIDVYRYALAGARATGIDLTPRHVELARAHLAAMDLEAEIVRATPKRCRSPTRASTASRATASSTTRRTCPRRCVRSAECSRPVARPA